MGRLAQNNKKYKDYFTAILSDLTMGNIDYKDRFDFYQAIYNAIKPEVFYRQGTNSRYSPHFT